MDGAYLAGLLQVQDAFGLKGIAVSSTQTSGTLTRAFCGAVDYNGLTGCTHVGDRVAILYSGLIDGPPDSTAAGSISLVLGEPQAETATETAFYFFLSAYRLTYAGDSMCGRFAWGHTPVAIRPPIPARSSSAA